MPDIWATLCIPATSDQAAVRRAYAARLRTIDTATDPAAFIALRAAYDAALQFCAGSALRDAKDHFVKTAPKMPPIFADQSLQEQRHPEQIFGPDRAALLNEILARDGVIAAWKNYVSWMARGEITLSQQIPFAEIVLQAAVADKSLAQDRFVQIANSLAPDNSAWRYGDAPALQAALEKRLAAYRWLDALRATAALRPAGKQKYQVRAARLFLGMKKRLSRNRFLLDAIAELFKTYHEHQEWLDNGLDAHWLKSLENSWARKVKSNNRRAWIFYGAIFAFLAGDILFVVARAIVEFVLHQLGH